MATTKISEYDLGTVKVAIKERPMPRSEYDPRWRRWYMTYTWREYESYPRVYVSNDDSFNVVENFVNRGREPFRVWRQPTLAALAEVGVEFEKMNWSKHAGCSMCPCSPGFILKHGTHPEFDRFDVWVTIVGAPAVDESKPVDPARIDAVNRFW